MKVTPIQSPSQTIDTGASNRTPAALAARERAIAMLTGAQASQTNAQDAPVANPTQVSPEELSAVKAPESAEKVQTDTIETPAKAAVTPEAKAAPEEPLSDRYAQLAKRERAIQAKAKEQAAATKQRETELAAREEAIKARESQYQDPKKYISEEELLANPWATLAKRGVTYDQLTEQALNQPSQEVMMLKNELQSMRDEIKSLKGDNDKTRQTFEDSQKQNYEQAVNEIRRETNKLVKSDPNFEMIKATSSAEDVVELIKKTFAEDGELLSVEDAAQQIEDYLVEQAERLARTGKIQKRLQPPVQADNTKQEGKDTQQQPQTKTLTNAHSVTRPLTSKERAILAFKGELKK